MFVNKKIKSLLVLAIIGLFVILQQVIFAQDGVTITVDTPASIELVSSTDVVSVRYEALENQAVVFQAMSDIAHPTLQILKDGVEIAKYRPANTTTPSITLPAYLTAGTYTIRISALNEIGATARILVGVMSQSAVTPETLSYGQSVQGTILSDAPIVLYQFEGVFEQSQVIAHFSPVGANFRIFNVETEDTWLDLSSRSIGGRLYLPETEGQFHAVIVSDVTQPITYTLCYVAMFHDCDGNATPPPAEPTFEQPAQPQACVAVPLNPGGANIRQSASTSAPIIGALAGGQSVPVIGIDPSGTWYQVVFNAQIGWASLAAVGGEGDCAGLPPVNPPPIQVIPTATPAPETAVPSITPLPTSDATATVTPTATITSTASPTETPFFPVLTLVVPFPTINVPPVITFVPPPLATLNLPIITLVPPISNCTVTFTGAEYLYTRPNPIVDYLLHQTVGGETYNVVGRFSGDNSWYRIDFYDGWWHNVSGTTGVLNGNCSTLPTLSAP
jgi:hypothetical protein